MNVYNIIIYIYIYISKPWPLVKLSFDIFVPPSVEHSVSTRGQRFNTHMNTAAHMAAVIQPTCSISWCFLPVNRWLPPAFFLLFPRRSTQLPGITRASSSSAVTQTELWPYGTSEARASPSRQSPRMVRRWTRTNTHTLPRKCLQMTSDIVMA